MLRAAKKLSENTPAKFVHTDSRVMGKFLRYDKLKDTWSSCKFDSDGFWRQPLYTVISMPTSTRLPHSTLGPQVAEDV